MPNNDSKKGAEDKPKLPEQADVKKQRAATMIQKTYRGFSSRKKTNIFGTSQGKEVEVYLPFGVRNKTTHAVSCEDMFGGYKYLLCKSDLFNIQLDHMNFQGQNKKFSIPEIVTAPYRHPNEVNTNLPTEEEIDKAVSDFLQLLQNFAKQASTSDNPSILPLEDLLKEYNKKHPQHPLYLASHVKRYLQNPQRRELFTQQLVPVKQHQNTELCLVYDAKKYPQFDSNSTPRTTDAKKIVDQKGYKSGELIVHIQKTFSLKVEDYTPENISKDFNITEFQMKLLKLARMRAEQLIKQFPLPSNANREKILGLLTICTEHMLSLINAEQYTGLHEKIDRPVLSIRHILHYVKLNICNTAELGWFDSMFKEHLSEIQQVLGNNQYDPDFRGKGERTWGMGSQSLASTQRYDVVFDLFGDFANKKNYTAADSTNPYLEKNASRYGIKSWEDMFANHMSLSGRTHLVLQKSSKEFNREYMLLFEARRIGMMTVDEFRKGKSRISLSRVKDTKYNPKFYAPHTDVVGTSQPALLPTDLLHKAMPHLGGWYNFGDEGFALQCEDETEAKCIADKLSTIFSGLSVDVSYKVTPSHLTFVMIKLSNKESLGDLLNAKKTELAQLKKDDSNALPLKLS